MSERQLDTVVTYLEARQAPRKLPPSPSGARFALIRAAPIALHYYRYLYGLVGADWWWIDRTLLSDEALAKEVHKDGIEISVLYGNGSPAGYFELDFSAKPDVDLSYFGLAPDWTGRGLGAWFLASAMAEAFNQGAERLTVNTCTLDHPAALALYQKLGFSPYAQETKTMTVPSDWPRLAHAQTATTVGNDTP